MTITSAKAKTIYRLAKAIEHGDVDLSVCADPVAEMENLMGIPGIGRWTARYVAMRGMGWTDAILDTDLGVRKALAPLTSKEIMEVSKDWIPWRSYATINLWNSLRTREQRK